MSARNILFDSPALHSLKRAQLVKLCKRYNIKASGKNAELVERLKQHASTLPSDAELTNAGLSEQSSDNDEPVDEEGSEDVFARPARPSEMWEVVMDDIPEEDYCGSQQGTLRSKKSSNTLGTSGEFGVGGSSKSTVTSSIKAIASSLGLKRATSQLSISGSDAKGSVSSRKALANGARDSLLAHAVPYSEIPATAAPPQTEPFTITINNAADTSVSSMDRPIPGATGREGVDASMLAASGIEGTIRLVTTSFTSDLASPPKLQPFQPTFDLIPPTPGKVLPSIFPLSPTPNTKKRQSLYPDLSSILGVPAKPDTSEDGGENDVARPGMSLPRSEPFIFGSPHPRYSATKSDFSSAAASVLAEMNARLEKQGVKTLSNDLVAGSGGGKMSEDEILNHQFGGKKEPGKDGEDDKGSVKWKFDRAHEKEFNRMAGIDQHYAARRPGATEPLEPLPANRKRKSNALGSGRPSQQKRRSSNARVISAGTRKKMGIGMPGGFGDDDEDAEEPEEREAKRVCVPASEGDGDEHAAERVKRVSIAPAKQQSDAEKKEREAIKRRLEYNKAKRRSSMGRPSLVAQQKAKSAPGRFGFLSSAKSLVKAVWNRGAGAPAPATSAPAAKPAARPAPSVSSQSSKASALKPPIPDAKKPSFDSVRSRLSANTSTSRVASASRKVSSSGGLAPSESGEKAASIRSAASGASSKARARSPIPSFSMPGSSLRGARGSTVSSQNTTNTKIGVSSIGTRRSITQKSEDAVGSLGVKARTRPSSTLFAPTASSLAKMTAKHPAATAQGLKVPECEGGRKEFTPSPSKIPVISPLSPKPKNVRVASGTPGKIFSKPLVLPTSPAATEAAEMGMVVNPITGATSPSREPLADSDHTNRTGGASSEGADAPKVPSLTRKPRISRSKVLAKASAHRTASTSTAGSVLAPRASGGAALVAKKGRTRSSIGVAAANRKLAGAGAAGKAGRASGAAMMISAKKRARQSEFARRRSVRPSQAQAEPGT